MRIFNSILKFSPLFLLVGALIAIKYNLGGFRDLLDKAGEALGNMLPGLRPFLNLLRAFAEGLGLLDKGFDFDHLKQTWLEFVDEITNDTNWTKVLDNMVTRIETFINTFDWSTAWVHFQAAMVSTGEWIGERLGFIGAKVVAYFQDPGVQKMMWEGFQYAMVGAGTWIYEQLGKIGDAIIGYFGNPDVQSMLWEGFQYAMVAAGTWIYEQLGKIGDAIIGYFGDPDVQKMLWDGFQAAMYATGTWLFEQLGKIGDAIIGYFGNPDVQKALWEGFQGAMYAAGTWLFEQLGKIGDAIIGYFGDPDVQKALWDGFQTAMYATGEWLVTNLGKILNDVFVFFSDKKNTDAMWKGFRDAMYAAGVWVGEMLTKILQFVSTWWGANQDKLTDAFFDFWEFIFDQATTAGEKIPGLILDGIEAMASKLTEAGEFIWSKMKSGLLSIVPDANIFGFNPKEELKKLIGEAQGGVIRTASAARGAVFTTRGKTLVMAGDNPGGQEDVAFIPRNAPDRALNAIDSIYGRRAAVIGGGGGKAVINISIPVMLGGKTIDHIIKTVEIELGKNFRSIQ